MKIALFSEDLRECLNAAGFSDCGENDAWNYWYQRLMKSHNECADRGILTEQAENAKLRELVRDLYCLAFPRTMEWEVANETYDKYSPCELCEKAHGGKSPCASATRDMSDECCTPFQADVVAERMRVLGVEVDE